MMRAHELSPYGYNEVLVSTFGEGWAWADRMPDLIEAFVSVGGGELQDVRAIHGAFHRRYPKAKAGLVAFDLWRGGEPFSDI